MRLLQRSITTGLATVAVLCGTAIVDTGTARAADYCSTFPSDPLCPIWSEIPSDLQTVLQANADELTPTAVDAQIDTTPTLPPPDAVISGLYSGDSVGTPPVPSGMFVRTNGWTNVDSVTGNVTAIWAGSSAVSPSLGMVVVSTYDAGMTQLLTVKAITGPVAVGAYTISRGLANTVTMGAADGSTWVFDPSVGAIVKG